MPDGRALDPGGTWVPVWGSLQALAQDTGETPRFITLRGRFCLDYEESKILLYYSPLPS